MAEKDTVFPVYESPPKGHPPGQFLHQGLMGIQILPLLPGPLPVTEVYLEHSDMVELLCHFCKQRNNIGTAPLRQDMS